jgi:hypothetical protein
LGTPKELVVQSKDKIIRAPEELASLESKKELIAVLGLLATRVLKDPGTIKRLLTEIRQMGENYMIDLLLKEGEAKGLEKGIEKGIEKGLEKGLEKGRREEALRAIRRVIVHRFGEVPPAWKTASRRSPASRSSRSSTTRPSSPLRSTPSSPPFQIPAGKASRAPPGTARRSRARGQFRHEPGPRSA